MSFTPISRGTMQSLTPISRAAMQGLKAAKDEEHRQRRIKNTVEQLYRATISFAETHVDTSHKHRIQDQGTTVADLPDILLGLQGLFPDCTVSFKSMAQGPDGKFYDVSTMDPQFLPLINKRLNQDFIIIDWS